MKKLFILEIIVLFFLVILIFIYSKSYSKYLSSYESQVSTKLAKPCFDVKFEEFKNIDYLNQNISSYEFAVKNYIENDSTSDISFLYDIFFEISQKDAPIVMRLYRLNDDGQVDYEVELYEYKSINHEYIDVLEKENKYRLDIQYDLNSNIVLEPNFKIKTYIEAIQKEENV